MPNEEEELRDDVEEAETPEVTENEQPVDEDPAFDDSSYQDKAQAVVNGTKAVKFFIKYPWAIPAIIILIVFLFLCIFIAADSENETKANTGNMCTYNLKGISSTGTVSLENLQVELINCDAKKNDYTVLKTVDFEKYVLGVALAEIGESSPNEAIKAQIVAARNFALTRNRSMCPGAPDSCWLGYNKENNKIRLRACEADQVYWDYTEDIYRQNRGSISLYSPEVTDSTQNAVKWKTKLSDERKAAVEFLATEVVGKVMYDSENNVKSVGYNSTISNIFMSDANAGMTYDQILIHAYGSVKYTSATCTSAGNIDYGDYSLSSEGDTILHERLDTFLASKGTSIDEYNALIESNVNKSGFGTKAGVVAAAVTLIGELGDKYDIKLPYFWGGGHGSISNLASANWGGTSCKTVNNGISYSYCGMDCSGFVTWALYNGGFKIPITSSNNFHRLVNQKTTLSSSSATLEPGDLLESSGHVVLVVGVDEENKKYICAEASGNREGIKFSKKDFAPRNYWGVKLDSYFNETNNIRSK